MDDKGRVKDSIFIEHFGEPSNIIISILIRQKIDLSFLKK